jgi:hypothetical protein
MSDPFDTSHYRPADDPILRRAEIKHETKDADLRPFAAPLSQWSEAQKRALYDNVSVIGQVMQDRAIRPPNPAILADLRRIEAERARTAGVADVTLVRLPHVNEKMYVKNGPLAWSDVQPGMRHVERSGHSHIENLALLVDVRYLREAPELLYLPFEELSQSTSPHVPYLCLTQQLRKKVEQVSAHESFLRFVAQRHRGIPLKKLIAIALDDFGMRLHAVVFRYDGTIQLALALDREGHFFGMVTLGRRPNDVRDAVAKDMRARLSVDTSKDASTIGIEALKVSIAQQVASRSGGVALDMYESAYFDFIGVKSEKTVLDAIGRQLDETEKLAILGRPPRDDQAVLLRCCASMVVFSPHMSPTLQELVVDSGFGYFVACQCQMPKREVRRYARAYARAARLPTLAELPTLDADHMPPAIDVPDEKTDKKRKNDV